MATRITLNLDEELVRSIERQVQESELFETPSDYISHLVLAEERKWRALNEQLRPGMEAGRSEFEPFDIEDIISRGKTRNASRHIPVGQG